MAEDDSASAIIDTPFVVITALLLRWLVSLSGYSGQATPPNFGDYEAQRHWMEVTLHLPLADWYRNTPLNDLQYWGLDYPPLTAYVSLACGWVCHLLEPASVALTQASKGYETDTHKALMRFTVLVLDALVYFPAAWVLSRKLYCFGANRAIGEKSGRKTNNGTNKGRASSEGTKGGAKKKKEEEGEQKETAAATAVPTMVPTVVCFALSLLQPALILIDHGHFQYNSVSLGLALAAAACLMQQPNEAATTSYLPSLPRLPRLPRSWSCSGDVLGSVLFCLSLNFKQMSLYFAPAFFCHLLGKCASKPTHALKLLHLVKIGSAVVATFALLWSPFCALDEPTASCSDSLLQVLQRLFPFGRGLFEDKVANLWFALSVPFKDLRFAYSPTTLKALSLGATSLLLAPVCVDLFRAAASTADDDDDDDDDDGDTEPSAPSQQQKQQTKWRPAKAKTATPTMTTRTRTAAVRTRLNSVRLLLGLTNSALAFFLCSFQVHEKSFLLALSPLSFLLLEDPLFVVWVSVVAAFSMHPLLVRDGQSAPYACCVLLFLAAANAGVDHSFCNLGNSVGLVGPRHRHHRHLEALRNLVVTVSFAGMAVLHGLRCFAPAPFPRYPDLYPVLFALFSFAHFVLAYMYTLTWQLRLTSRDLDGTTDGTGAPVDGHAKLKRR